LVTNLLSTEHLLICHSKSPSSACQPPGHYNFKYSVFETWWHTRRNQISSFAKMDESI